MNKKGEISLLLSLIVLLMVIVIGVWFSSVYGFIDYSSIKNNFFNKTSDVVDMVDDYSFNDYSDDINICSSYTNNYNDYFIVKSIQCSLVGGDYVCEPNTIGCFNIDNWDFVNGCSSEDAQLMKGACSVLGGIWSCDSKEISCERS